jgi:methylmalonyl-CoA epimerase
VSAQAPNGPGWPPRRIHHVAFAHREGAVLEQLPILFGLHCTQQETGPGFEERLFPVGEGFVQTLEATGPGVVESFVQKRGAALHHIAFEVEDLEEALEDLKQRGAKLVDQQPRPGGAGTRVAFLHPSACGGMLVELVEVGTKVEPKGRRGEQ